MKSFKSIPLIALLSLGAVCHTASAQDQTPKVEKYPVSAAGTRFSYVNGVFLLKCNRWEVKEVNKSGEIVSKCGNNTMYVTAESGNPVRSVNDKGETVAKFTPFYPDVSFPLFVGKKWTGKYSGEEGSKKWTSEVSCEAAAQEDVSVTAGKFQAFRIECVDKWDAGIIFINGKKKSTRWYAPSVGLIVKSINDDSQWNTEVAGNDWR
jgi:hypothetical protein